MTGAPPPQPVAKNNNHKIKRLLRKFQLFFIGAHRFSNLAMRAFSTCNVIQTKSTFEKLEAVFGRFAHELHHVISHHYSLFITNLWPVASGFST